MATIAIQAIQVGPLLGLLSTPQIRELEANSQTFLRGGPVKFSSGKIAEAGASVASVQKIRAPASDKILGIATENGKNDAAATNKTGAVPPIPGVIYEGNVYHGTAASAVLAQSQVGTSYGLREHPTKTDKWVVNLAESSASVKCVTIVGLKDAVGDTYGRVYFTIRDAWREITV